MYPAFSFIISIILGLIFGSFANVVAYRLPRKVSIIKPGSHCPACKHSLPVLALIPVISWLALGRRCLYCRTPISIRYPAVEIGCALLFLGVIRHTDSLSVVPLFILVFLLLCIAIIDADTQEIPDGLLLIGAFTGLVWIIAANTLPVYFPAVPHWRNALFGMITGALPLWILDRLSLLLVKKDGFGYGDMKLMAMAGIFLGWQAVLVAYFFAFIVGGLYAAFLLFTKRAERGAYIAFGPFLCAGIIAALWWEQAFLLFLFP